MQSFGQGGVAGEEPLLIETPYQLASPPAFDVILEGSHDTRREDSFTRRYDLRVAGDLLFTNAQGYLASDSRGQPSSARLLLERRSAEGALPLGATRIGVGDVFTPTLALGPRSVAGRGFQFSTAPLAQGNLLNTIDLRGELPIGYDVELYVNDVLRSGQRTPVEGRYEFLDVPLVRGINVIRIVTYGPRGERSETVRVVNASGGLVPAGQTSVDIGVVQQRALFELRDLPTEDSGIGARNEGRVVMNLTHGLSDTFSLIGGAGIYSSRAGDERQMITGGLRASLAGFAVQLDAAGASGDLLGTSLTVRHAEYRDGFIDETSLTGDAERPLVRKTVAYANARLDLGGTAIPLSLRMMRDGFADGGSSWIASLRSSSSVMRTLISAGLDYARETHPARAAQERMSGNFDLSRLIGYRWQVRASATYDVLPDRRMRAASATVDRSFGDRLAMRLGVGHSFGVRPDTTVQGGIALRLPFGEIALTSDYVTQSREWRGGLRIAFGSIFDPGRRRYVATPPGPSTSASAAIMAFVDADADGQFGEGDEPVTGVSIGGGRVVSTTDAHGRALVTGLGISPTGRLQVDTGEVDQLFLVTPPATIEFAPRPGQSLYIPYAMTPSGEVFARIFLRRDGDQTGLAAVRMRLTSKRLPPLTAMTEFDGSVVFSNVPPGTYQLEMDPAQANRLGMGLREPMTVTVTAEGMADIEAEIILERSAS
jgi:hypothetical protein